MKFNSSQATIIHNSIPVILLLFCFFYANDGLLYIKSVFELWISISLCIMSGALFMEVSCSFTGIQLQNHKSAKSKMRVEEAKESLRAFFIFSCFSGWTRYFLAQGKPTALVFTLAEAQPEYPNSYLLYFVKLVAVTYLVDFYMYFKHRLLHWRPLWVFHSGHHSFHNPSPFGGFAVAPVEAVLTFAPVLSVCAPSLPILSQAYLLWVIGFVVLNLYLHAGWKVEIAEYILQPLGVNSSAFHNLHHEKTNTNFGELLYIWDFFLKTGSHPPSSVDIKTK